MKNHLNDILFYVIFLCVCQFVSCLYEDQIGKFDWRHQFIGRVDHVLRAADIWQDHQLLITSTQSGSLAGLYLRNGSINWRHILETVPINLLTSWPKSSEFYCPVLSVNGNGRWIRCWKTTGILIAEHFLPNVFLNEIEKDSSNHELLFEINKDVQNPILSIVKISFSNHLIEFIQYHFKTKKFESIAKITAGKWLGKSSCRLVTSDYLICIDQKDREFQIYDLQNHHQQNNNNNNRQFKRIPLSTFGLTSNNDTTTTTTTTATQMNDNMLTIQLLPDISSDKTTTISKSTNVNTSKYFALNLGNGQGIVLFKIVPELQDNIGGASIRMVKIFPYAVRMTIIPLISSTQEPSVSNHDDGGKNFDQLEYGAAILYTKKDPIPYEDKQDGQYQKKVYAAKLAIFHLDTWTEVTSISSKSMLFEFGSKRSVAPVTSNGKLVKRLDDEWSIDRFEIIPIRSQIQNSRGGRDQNRYTYKMLLTTVDGTMLVANLMGKINWAREEALAEINSLVVLDLPLLETYAILEQEYGFNEKNSNIFAMFFHRIKTQFIQLLQCARNAHQWILKSVTRLNIHKRKGGQNPKNHEDETNVVGDEINQNDNDDEYYDEENEQLIRDYFGFHKVIIARTNIGKLFAMDTLNGRIIWSKYDPNLAVKSDKMIFPIWTQRSSAHFPQSAICTIVNDFETKTYLNSFDPISGEVSETKWLPFKTIQAMLVQSIHDDEFRRPLLLLDSDYRAWLYPDRPEVKKLFAPVANKHFMMIVNQTSALISGYGFTRIGSSDQELNPSLVWSFRLPYELNKLNTIKVAFKRPHERVHSQGRVLGDRNVLYKYLNPNLVVILCESLDAQEKSQITVYLIDSITGNIIYSIVHRRARGPSQIVHSENWVIYSYYNDKMRRNEISSIELYEGFNQVNSTAFSSIGRDLLAIPMVEQKAFIFPTGIGVMTDTETLKGITSKHILISLPTGGILELPRAFLDPRRPIKPTQEHAEEGLIPYVPELPIPSETIINYNQTVFSVRGIVTTPASLESTSLVCVYGLDFYYTRVAPSKTFDILKDDFDHLLILAVLTLLILMSYLAKYLAAKKSLNAAWK